VKLLYKPLGIVLGLMAGLLGRRLFNFVWGKLDEEEPPEATTELAPWPKVLGAAALQGAIFAVVRAAVNRGGAKTFEHLTGVWPGERRPEPE
jgi:hypothetical protein